MFSATENGSNQFVQSMSPRKGSFIASTDIFWNGLLARGKSKILFISKFFEVQWEYVRVEWEHSGNMMRIECEYVKVQWKYVGVE